MKRCARLQAPIKITDSSRVRSFYGKQPRIGLIYGTWTGRSPQNDLVELAEQHGKQTYFNGGCRNVQYKDVPMDRHWSACGSRFNCLSSQSPRTIVGRN